MGFDRDHLELSKKLGGAAPYFAPRHQQYKAGFIWALAFALEAYALTVRRSWALATVLGFLYAMIGLNIQHDANHGAMFKDGLKNMASYITRTRATCTWTPTRRWRRRCGAILVLC